MRKTFTICFSILILSISISAQNETKPCPLIQTASPTEAIMPGETITFSVKVGTESENSKLEYDWVVSLGTIIEGQGASAIKVVTTPEMNGESVTAKITIQGLPTNCINEKSETKQVEKICVRCGESYDDYGKVSKMEEEAHLYSLFTNLADKPKLNVFFQLALAKNDPNNQIKKRIKRILEFADSMKIDRERLRFSISKYKYDEPQTNIYLTYEFKDFPICKNCEIIKGEDVK